MNGFIIPSLRSAMIWLTVIMVVCFIIGAVLIVLESDKSEDNIHKKSDFYYPSKDIENAQIDLEIDSGSVVIKSGEESEMISGRVFFEGMVPEPSLSHIMVNGTGNYFIEREKNILHDLIGGEENWNISLGNKSPIFLNVKLGAGDITFNSGDIRLKNVKLENGAGELFLDIHEWKGDNLDMSIETGIGDLTLIFPENSDIFVTRDQGVVNSVISGFSVNENGYIHNSTSRSNSTITVSITQGIGELNLKTIS